MPRGQSRSLGHCQGPQSAYHTHERRGERVNTSCSHTRNSRLSFLSLRDFCYLDLGPLKVETSYFLLYIPLLPLL